jgi:NAD(P)-dependent dehydrogenase (short-subunit alcohol dehydrogenase family)
MPRIPDVTVPDQSGRLALVTGASGGVGLELAVRLAQAGAELLLPVRDPGRGERAAARIRGAAPAARVDVRELDLAAQASVHALADELLAEGRPLHLLVANAGVMTPPERRETADGFELQLATNHLGHATLVARLLPLLREGRARVVTQSSIAAASGSVHWEDLQWSSSYDAEQAYRSSKIAGSLWGLELGRRSVEHGWGITSVLAHPGISATSLLASRPELGREGDGWQVRLIRRMAASPIPLAQPAAAGALPALLAATDPAVRAGSMVGPGGPLHLAGAPGDQRLFKPLRAEEDGARTWEVTRALTGVEPE